MSTDTSEAVEPAAHWARLPLRDLGSAAAPLDPFPVGPGLETLSQRVERHVANAALEHGFTAVGGITDSVGGGRVLRTSA
jgi:O-acetylhomoserine/O-acetylserine sulfhydrylase-like pyridoxal-dependent enzyme